VKAALLREPQLKSLDVSVETYRGEVLLSGFVKDEKQRAQAQKAASTIADDPLGLPAPRARRGEFSPRAGDGCPRAPFRCPRRAPDRSNASSSHAHSPRSTGRRR
jgi:hypothetical protein